ncbi:hypothetical protein EON65_47630 [archaeon]|nr:MAG: hypothetical protein EON65_47630 [archaeon]
MLSTSAASLLDESTLATSQQDFLQDTSISLTNTSAISIVSDQSEKEKECYGFIHPPKIARKLPLLGKSSDPAQCLEVLDDIYAFYQATQVGLCLTFMKCVWGMFGCGRCGFYCVWCMLCVLRCV